MYKIITDINNTKFNLYPILPDVKIFMEEIWPEFGVDVDFDSEEPIMILPKDSEEPFYTNIDFNDGSIVECSIGMKAFVNFNEHSIYFELIIATGNGTFYNIILDKDYFGEELMAEIMDGRHNC